MPAWVARAAAAPRLLRWRCRRLAAACPVRLVGDIRHATAVFHKVFGQENKPGAPVTSSQGARDTTGFRMIKTLAYGRYVLCNKGMVGL